MRLTPADRTPQEGDLMEHPKHGYVLCIGPRVGRCSNQYCYSIIVLEDVPGFVYISRADGGPVTDTDEKPLTPPYPLP